MDSTPSMRPNVLSMIEEQLAHVIPSMARRAVRSVAVLTSASSLTHFPPFHSSINT